MSLTEAEGIFVGLHENGLTDFLEVILVPRLRNYRSSPLWPSQPPANQWTTSNAPLTIFGVTVDYAFQLLTTPQADIDPFAPTSPWQTAAPGEIVWTTKAAITLQAGQVFLPLPPSYDVAVQIFVQTANTGVGTGEITFGVGQVNTVPQDPFVALFVQLFLTALLANVKLPFEAVRLGAFSLTLSRGPETELDQVQLYGTVV